ncbi:UPF0575 protein C19orf67 homolog [Brachionichthys hirsutus]|uniref:UPF0575 protein C19orf67 homolog n=1 Tax=Brachionichthys hirsutus TaxID=412623 RepID=UPI003604B585
MDSVTDQFEVELVSISPLIQPEFGDLRVDVGDEAVLKCEESNQSADLEELQEPLMLLADVALATPAGCRPTCACDSCNCLEVSIQFLQLQIYMSKADDLQENLVNNQNNQERELYAAEVPHFLQACQPYFSHLESAARSIMFQFNALPFDIYTRLLDFSQQLSDRLVQLVLSYAGHNLLCLDETEPNGVSHFCTGQCRLGQLRLSTFRYCRMTPYLAQFDTGLYKRMRWNVDRLADEQQQQQQPMNNDDEGEADTEYYFLCCEDIPNTQVEAGGDGRCTVGRMWSIGQWVQAMPDPDTEDVYDWIMCEVPQGGYERLLLLGSEEPSSRSATDSLQLLLLSQFNSE